MVYCWKETNMSILSRKSRSQKNVSNTLGKATYDVRPTTRLVEVVSLLAANYTGACPRDKLDTWIRITFTETNNLQ